MFVGGDCMLQDYEIKRPTDKRITILEFILVLLIFHSATMLFFSTPNEEAIQFRILAHSNAKEDQSDKEKVYEAIQPLLQQTIENSKSIDELVDNFREIEPIVISRAQSIVTDKEITFKRINALIPPKKSGFYIQPQAEYDAYILTIGSGRGDNWWCSLFSNICFPDEEKEDEKVTFFIWEWIKDFFS